MIEAELHDGTVLEFPDGTAQEVIARAVKARGAAGTGGSGTQGATAAPEGALEPSKPFQRAGGQPAGSAGVNQSVIRGAMGLKSLFTDLSPEDKGVLKEMKDEADADPEPITRAVGDVAGTMAATAIPAAGAASNISAGLRMLPNALKWLAPTVTGAVVSGGQGALLDPATGTGAGERAAEKATTAGKDAAIGGAFGGAGSVLMKAVKGMFRPSAEAVNLMQMGITPTLQQGSESGVGKFVGGLTSAAIDPRARQNQEVVAEYLRRAAPGQDFAGMTVPETVAALRTRFLGEPTANIKGEYGDLYDGKTFQMGPTERSAIWKAARGQRGMQPEAKAMATQAMGGTGAAMTSGNIVRMKAEKMQEYRGLLDDAIKSMSGPDTMSSQAKEALRNAKSTFDTLVRDKALTPDELSQLSDINARYTLFSRLQDAAKSPSTHVQMKVNDLNRSFANADETGVGFATAANPTHRELLEPAARVMGLTPTQNEARAAMTALKRSAGQAAVATGAAAAGAASGPLAAILAPLYAMSLAGQTKTGARVLFGQTDTQKSLAEILRKAAPYGAGVGGAVGGAIQE